MSSDDLDIAIPVKEYEALAERIRRERRVMWIDKGGRECYLVLDNDRSPRREDDPKRYIKLVVESLEDLAILVSIYKDNARAGIHY